MNWITPAELWKRRCAISKPVIRKAQQCADCGRTAPDVEFFNRKSRKCEGCITTARAQRKQKYDKRSNERKRARRAALKAKKEQQQ